MQQRRAGGFTLIEVLLVILLIGVLASMVVYNFQGESRSQRLSKETDKLQARIQLASELAMLKNLELGLFLDEHSYRFMLFADNKWLPIREPKALAEHQLAEGVHPFRQLMFSQRFRLTNGQPFIIGKQHKTIAVFIQKQTQLQIFQHRQFRCQLDARLQLVSFFAQTLRPAFTLKVVDHHRGQHADQ